MQIKQTPLSDLHTNEANPRTITDGKFGKLIGSLLVLPKMLELRPIVTDSAGTALGGNMRLRALQAIADLSPEDVELRLHALPDFAKKSTAQQLALIDYWRGWLEDAKHPVPSVVADELSDGEKREFIIKDNASFGEWDWDALSNEWDTAELNEWGLDVWEPTDEGVAADAQEDDFDEGTDAITVRCKPGDIWQLGEHRLMCGDSVDLQQVKALMGGARADMVFTDPPYGVSIGDKNAELNTVQEAGRCCTNIKNDTLSVPALYDVLKQAMQNVRENCADDACYYVCAPPGGDMGLMMMMMKDAGLNVRHQIVWNKNSATFSLGRLDYDYKHEAIMYTWTDKHHNYRKGAFRTSVWDIDKPRKCDLHPTMKPVELVTNAILDGSKEGDIVLDSFGGSGTTLIAAEQLGRKCYMMELDPHYCDVIIARWEKLTGQTATRLTS